MVTGTDGRKDDDKAAAANDREERIRNLPEPLRAVA